MKIKTFGSVDERSLRQLERCMEAGDAELGVLCADHHPGYSQPIGGAIAYEGYVSPSGVGYDTGCGNKAVCTELTRSDLGELGGVESVMREITRGVSFGMGVPARERADHPVLDRVRRAEFAPQRKLAELASLVSTPTPAGTWLSARCSRSSPPARCTRSTITTTSHGGSRTSAVPTAGRVMSRFRGIGYLPFCRAFVKLRSVTRGQICLFWYPFGTRFRERNAIRRSAGSGAPKISGRSVRGSVHAEQLTAPPSARHRTRWG